MPTSDLRCLAARSACPAVRVSHPEKGHAWGTRHRVYCASKPSRPYSFLPHPQQPPQQQQQQQQQSPQRWQQPPPQQQQAPGPTNGQLYGGYLPPQRVGQPPPQFGSQVIRVFRAGWGARSMRRNRPGASRLPADGCASTCLQQMAVTAWELQLPGAAAGAGQAQVQARRRYRCIHARPPRPLPAAKPSARPLGPAPGAAPRLTAGAPPPRPAPRSMRSRRSPAPAGAPRRAP